MSLTRLVVRSAAYHWRTNLAVCCGVAAAVATLAGALLVGDSVRGSLRDLVLQRLGRTGHAITSTTFFREQLADDVAARTSAAAAPLIATTGFLTHEPSGRRASSVFVYGVDDRFWRFHRIEPRDGVFVSAALAAELGAAQGDVLLTRLQKPSEIPLESLYARKEDVARTVRLRLDGVLPRAQLGEFSLQPRQADVHAVFVPLRRLQRDLAAPGRVNTVLLADASTDAAAQSAFRASVALEDLGVKIGAGEDATTVTLESTSGIVGEALERAATDAGRSLGVSPTPVFTYLANTIRMGERSVPYSLVTGVDLRALPPARRAGDEAAEEPADAIVLNDWAARELGASPGQRVEIDYYLWDPAAGLRTATAAFTLTKVVPMAGLAADRRLAPEYPGITSAASLADWDPPFPVDLSRVRKQDEQYWDDHRATPKAFIPYERARELWSTRYGRITSLRFAVPPTTDVRFSAAAATDAAALVQALRRRLTETVVPASQGMVLSPTRRLALEASAGATNFGEYFTYFSFFLVFSALLLATLFFRLGVEQRLRQIGILRASGFTVAHVRRLLASEAAVVAAIGSAAGVAGAIAYAHAIVYGLKTWWVGAVGTTLLEVHVGGMSLLLGAAGGILAAIACVLWSLRAVSRRSPRALLAAYSLDPPAAADPRRGARAARAGAVAAVAGLSLLTLGFVSPATQAGAFFGAGAALVSAFLLALSAWLRASGGEAITGRGPWAVSRLGFRGAAFRPGRSVLSAALIACTAFIIVSVDAFRRGGGELTEDPKSGTGGFALLATSDVPIVHNPNDAAGREALMIRAPELERVRVSRFRVRPGEDASCLNLYRPGTPTIISPDASFVDANRFTFVRSLAETEAERRNPWLLLRRRSADGEVPVIADDTSLKYVLHAAVGDTIAMDVGGERPLTLRFVGALRDSVLQGELVMGEDHFTRLFPGHEGFRFFLIEAPGVRSPTQAAALAEAVERELEPFGVDAVSTTDRLAAFHRVENTYLSTFQALGGLGLLLGTVGLATVMFRNVLERRRELALLRAVGYDARHVTVMILAETALLVGSGVAAGAGGAAIAIAPAWLERGSAPGLGLALLLAGVLLAGLVSAAAATRAALSGRLLEALRSE